MIGSQIIDECYWRLQTFFDKENGSCRFGFFGYSKDFFKSMSGNVCVFGINPLFFGTSSPYLDVMKCNVG